MITIRRSEERGHVELGWLNSIKRFPSGAIPIRRTTIFERCAFLNQDCIAPGKGFGAHGHRDMEIFTYVMEGGLAHRDSMGEKHVLRPNMIQAMSAGNGVIHSEFNGSQTEPVHLLQCGSRQSWRMSRRLPAVRLRSF